MSGLSGQRVLVTGGAGFVGSHVVDAFLARGCEVLAVDDLSSGEEGNVPAAAVFERLDVADGEALASAVTRFRPAAICHLAAQASVTVSVEDPVRDFQVNAGGTLAVCEAARAVGAPVVFASTGGALYGNGAPLPTPEDFVARPLAPYGASKLAGEAYVATWARLLDVPNVVLRLGNVYGPRQNPHGEAGVVAIFSDRLLAGEAPVVYGHGRPTRDYVHVRDVSRAFVLAAESGRPGTFNVGTGRETSVTELLSLLQEAAGTSLVTEQRPLRVGELERSALHSGRIRAEIGWEAEVALDAGLAETFRWYAGR